MCRRRKKKEEKRCLPTGGSWFTSLASLERLTYRGGLEDVAVEEVPSSSWVQYSPSSSNDRELVGVFFTVVKVLFVLRTFVLDSSKWEEIKGALRLAAAAMSSPAFSWKTVRAFGEWFAVAGLCVSNWASLAVGLWSAALAEEENSSLRCWADNEEGEKRWMERDEGMSDANRRCYWWEP